MKYKYTTSLLALSCVLCLVPYAVSAVVRRPSKASGYAQVSAMMAATQQSDQYYENIDTGAVNGLPVAVANQDMADAISGGGTYKNIGISELDTCSRIYPNGEFAWATPTVGRGRGGGATCVAVVELRSTDPVSGGTERNPLLARAYLAAGDSFNCNISDFPEDSYTLDAGAIEFPADKEPTREDVVKVMNNEQKQNAGIKIAALAVAGALGGNIVGKNEVGEEGLFGTGRNKMQSTAIGALGGAALGAGSVYGGKVGGDVILSTGVNAAAGAVVGNMIATGDEVLRVEDCIVNGTRYKCLWGSLVSKKELNLSDPSAANYKSAFYNWTEGRTLVCDGNPVNNLYQNCEDMNLISVVLAEYPGQTIDAIADQRYEKITGNNSAQFHLEKSTTGGRDSIGIGGGNDIWAKISSAGTPDGRPQAAMIYGVQDKFFGLKRSDWPKIRGDAQSAQHLVGRTGSGTVFDLSGEYSINDFYPMYVSAEDGGIIDFSNKARMKGTLIGAGAGGAMGAFVGYQGAQSDIENRWVTAVTEYKDSLQKVYCVTGNRFLSYYNDVVVIPAMNQ